MFSSKKCKNCDRKISDGWDFCPFCGERVDMDRVFDDVEKELKEIDKMFGSGFFNFPKIAMKPIGGISITISSGFGKEPRIEVRTPSGYKNLEPEIKNKLGVASSEVGQRTVRIPRVTEEPETKVQSSQDKKTISIKLPGVRSENEIDIRKLEQSVEVKAFADKKAYFTLVPVPSDFSITDRKFRDGVLIIDMEKR